MKPWLIAVLIGACVLVGGAIALWRVTARWPDAPAGPIQYRRVDEVMADPARYRGRELKLHGYAERVQRGAVTEIVLAERGQRVTVRVKGSVPDTLAERAEVVARGELTDDGFVATEVMAKCPSTYNTAQGPKPAAQFR